MIELIATTLGASAVDSMNPIAITQQFVLQGLVKKPHHIWYFILPTGIVSILFGYLAYFGLIQNAQQLLNDLPTGVQTGFYYTAAIFGGILLGLAGWTGIRNARRRVQNSRQSEASERAEEETARKKIKSVKPAALVLLGVGATIAELTTAMPYYAFLLYLFRFHLSFVQITLLLVTYNVIYMLPLIVMYIVYIAARKYFDRFYLFCKKMLSKASVFLVPLTEAVCGVFCLVWGITQCI